MEDLPKILVGQYDSPVTRRVAIALHHYGIPFTRDTRSIFGDAAAIGGISPLTRIPALVLDDGEVLINEINSLPGFTRISMYPKLWQASGLGYGELVTRLIELALERHVTEAAYKSGRA